VNLCPCQSGKQFSACCQPILQGKLKAATVLQLMRSRFCAFKLANTQYLRDTWHPDYRPDSLELDPLINWLKLEIIASNQSMVHFRAYSLSGNQVNILEEKSQFKKINNQWVYSTGDIIPTQAYKINRNSRCLCGSGKKFKQCCFKKDA
jgi:SEC-C motif domain protein